MIFNIHKPFLVPDHLTRQSTETKRKLQHSPYDDEKKRLDRDKYVSVHKEKHTIMESHADHLHSCIDNENEVHHFLQGIKSTQLEAAINAVWTEPEKYGKNFDATVTYLG